LSRSKSQKLPILSWREVVKKLAKLGFIVVPHKGSHIVLRREGKFIAIPRHKEIAPGTLLAIIRDPGLTKEEFLKLLDKR